VKQVNIHDAKTHLSHLIEEVEHGEDVVIARHNLRIPVNPATHSALNRPPIPVQTGHPVARL